MAATARWRTNATVTVALGSRRAQEPRESSLHVVPDVASGLIGFPNDDIRRHAAMGPRIMPPSRRRL